MKQVMISCLFIVLGSSINAQQEPLYYFISKDSLLGVKNIKGKIIIPARNRLFYEVKNGQKVESGLLNLIDLNDAFTVERKSWGKTYNRSGVFLYRPYNYDNGPDYLKEGLARFVENDKIGFVNRHGKKIIPAQFDYVEEFNLGTAAFCMGCYFNKKEGSEHPPLRGGYFGLINKEGNVLINRIPNDSSSQVWRKLDTLKSHFYSLQFRYTSFEKNLIEKFIPYKKTIEKQFFSNWSGFAEPKSLEFTIVERPTASFPYYVVYSMEKLGNYMHSGTWDGLEFYVSKDGKQIYFCDYMEKLVPFSKWYRIYSKGGRDYD
ncbi:MAG: WG repeat-containing protein [Bacteroidota bacterium]